MAGLAANLQHYLGPRLNDLAIKHNIQFNEIDLLLTNRTREHLLSLITNDIRLLNKLFVFKKHQHSPDKDLGEQKEIDDKEFTRKEHEKDKRITSIIKGLISKGLLEEAVSLYMYRERLKVLMLELRRLSALKEEAEYARQVAIYEAERAVLMQASQQALFLELERLQKEQNELFRQIKGHKEAIGHWSKVADDAKDKIKQLIHKEAEKLGDKLGDIIPEIPIEKRRAAAKAFLLEDHELEHKEIVLEAKKKQLEKRILKEERESQPDLEKIRKLKHDIINHPDYIKPEKSNNSDALSNVTFTTLFNTSQVESRQKLTQQLQAGQKSADVLLMVNQLAGIEERVGSRQQNIVDMKRQLTETVAQIKEVQEQRGKLPEKFETQLIAELSPERQKEVKGKIAGDLVKGRDELHKTEELVGLKATVVKAVGIVEENKSDMEEKLKQATVILQTEQLIKEQRADEVKENKDSSKDIQKLESAFKEPDTIQKELDSQAKQIEDDDDFLNSLEGELEAPPQDDKRASI